MLDVSSNRLAATSRFPSADNPLARAVTTEESTVNHQTRVYESITELLSNVDNPTPLVGIQRVSPFRHATV